MARVKTSNEVATIQLTPQCRATWETAAALEARSLANMFEVGSPDHCRRQETALPAPVPDVIPPKPAVRRRPSKNQQEG